MRKKEQGFYEFKSEELIKATARQKKRSEKQQAS